MYLVMPDRFDDGDPANNDRNGISDARNPLAVQGGDLAGVLRRLPYLQSLGVNAIWLTPVQQNVPGAFHGYWIQHFKRVDPRLGTMEDLRRIVREAHRLGMRVYLDVVCNHTGPLTRHLEGTYGWREKGDYTLAWKDSASLPTPAVLQDLSLYHGYGEVPKWEAPWQILGNLPGGLSDFRTEDARVLAAMIEIWSWWMEQSGCDGFRVDTVKHVDMPFWYAWLRAMREHARRLGHPRFFIFGEVYAADDAFCAAYTQPAEDGRRGFDAVLNFSMAEGIRDALGRNGSLAQLARAVEHLPMYESSARPLLLNFIDNHDMSRFLAIARGDTNRLMQALTFVYGLQGVPLLYYGTEQAFRGGTGPDWENRESMFAGGWRGDLPPGDSFDTTGRVFRHIAALNRHRATCAALRRGDTRVVLSDTTRRVLVLERRSGDTRAFVLLNSGDNEAELPFEAQSGLRGWPAGQLTWNTERTRLRIAAGTATLLLPLPGAEGK